jgi:translation initiation factor IF-2
VKELMADLLDPDLKENKLGGAEVRQVFPVAKGFVAGCLVTEGKINRGITARVRRGKESVFEGKIGTLRRFKDDANEVRAGLECGIKPRRLRRLPAGRQDRVLRGPEGQSFALIYDFRFTSYDLTSHHEARQRFSVTNRKP